MQLTLTNLPFNVLLNLVKFFDLKEYLAFLMLNKFFNMKLTTLESFFCRHCLRKYFADKIDLFWFKFYFILKFKVHMAIMSIY